MRRGITDGVTGAKTYTKTVGSADLHQLFILLLKTHDVGKRLCGLWFVSATRNLRTNGSLVHPLVVSAVNGL